MDISEADQDFEEEVPLASLRRVKRRRFFKSDDDNLLDKDFESSSRASMSNANDFQYLRLDNDSLLGI